tara:strand:+ start:3890 stop:4606 length:717 start_codon:yes stop_codon:yes gene_type:complete
MDNFQIETAQNISISQNVAHVTTRIGSFLIDILIIFAYNFLIFLFFKIIGYTPSFNNTILLLIVNLPTIFYSLIFEIAMNGQTPGKYLNKIRVVKIDGSKPTLGSYLTRWLLRIIDIWFFTGSVAVFTILFNGKGQRLGDIAAGTTIISEKKRVRLRDTLVEDLQDNYTPTFPQVTVLSDKDMHTIRELFITAKRKENDKLMLKLYIKVIALTNIKTDLQPIAFLEVVIKDYYHYTQQ